jgi:hypothetical protein
MEKFKMSKREIEKAKKLKGIKILDFLMFFGEDKIGFKFLEDKEHFTIKFLPDGIVDLHETIEGKEKKYPKTARLNLKRFMEMWRETPERELPKILKEIDIGNSEHENVEVIALPRKENMKKAIEQIEVKKKKIAINGNKFYDMFSYMRMKDLRDHDFQVAFWEKEGEQFALYRIDGRYFVLKVGDFSQLMDVILEKLKLHSEIEDCSTDPYINGKDNHITGIKYVPQYRIGKHFQFYIKKLFKRGL